MRGIGLFPALFAGDSDPKKSNLRSCSWTDNSFKAQVNFEISKGRGGRESLFDKFARAKRDGAPPGGSSGNALFAALGLFRTVELEVSLEKTNNLLEIKKP
jgi:hypothetical protein